MGTLDQASFEPRRWLDAFAEIGGGYALGADRRLAFLVRNCDGDKLTRAMAQIVGQAERQDALKTAIERRQLGEA
jgi:hypothetical protein